MFKKEVTQRVYAIEVGVKGLLDIIERDKDYSTPCVAEELEKLDGVWKVQYDGHFGPFVYLTVDVEDDTDKTWYLIKSIIKG